ncbi:hypothetical protein F5X98DRAFT_377013 [Xylaria grammica]|nr:hypothetical protein F5X98DRAFT_377013 [Xylaria grammica]
MRRMPTSRIHHLEAVTHKKHQRPCQNLPTEKPATDEDSTVDIDPESALRDTYVLLTAAPLLSICKALERSNGFEKFNGDDNLLCGQAEHQALYLWDHPNAPSYVFGLICITGDAARSITPWQGAGGGMCRGQSHSLLLARTPKLPTETLVALRVYHQVRRSRMQGIVECSRATGTILTSIEDPDPETLRAFMSRWDSIIGIDMKKHPDVAVQMMDARLKGLMLWR